MATEETKPVEREAFERWATEDLPQLPVPAATSGLACSFRAGWDAALERAAQIAEDHTCRSSHVKDLLVDAILALKGRK